MRHLEERAFREGTPRVLNRFVFSLRMLLRDAVGHASNKKWVTDNACGRGCVAHK